jgi:hypothetical protein
MLRRNRWSFEFKGEMEEVAWGKLWYKYSRLTNGWNFSRVPSREPATPASRAGTR